MFKNNKTIDLGVFDREDGTPGKLVFEVGVSGKFTISHMRTPDEGVIVGTGEFKEYIRGLPELTVKQLIKVSNKFKENGKMQPVKIKLPNKNPHIAVLDI